MDGVVFGRPEAPPLLLLHPAGMLHSVWLPLIRVLEPRFYLLAPDLPWQGPQAASLPALAEAVAELLHGRGLGPVGVVGASLGANVALHLALREPGLVSGLVLDSAQAGGPGGPPLLVRAMLALAPQRLVIAGMLGRFKGYPPADRAAVRAEMQRLGKAGFAAQLAAHTGHDLRDALPTLRAPTHLLFGARDRLTSSGQAELLRARIAGATSELVPRASHVTLLTDPWPLLHAVETMRTA